MRLSHRVSTNLYNLSLQCSLNGRHAQATVCSVTALLNSAWAEGEMDFGHHSCTRLCCYAHGIPIESYWCLVRPCASMVGWYQFPTKYLPDVSKKTDPTLIVLHYLHERTALTIGITNDKVRSSFGSEDCIVSMLEVSSSHYLQVCQVSKTDSRRYIWRTQAHLPIIGIRNNWDKLPLPSKYSMVGMFEGGRSHYLDMHPKLRHSTKYNLRWTRAHKSTIRILGSPENLAFSGTGNMKSRSGHRRLHYSDDQPELWHNTKHGSPRT